MDMNHNGLKIDASSNGVSSTLESPKVAMIEESDGDDDSKALLLCKNGGLSKKSEKPKRKVQWLDKNGDKLAQILEFQPSDVSDSEDEDSDSCICRVM
ncbi:hypothetical protein ACS0TY_022927 [Phlomoides rotata]